MTTYTSGQDASLQAELADTFEHLNGSHADTVAFVARHLSGDDLDFAELTEATRTEVRFEVGRGDQRRPFAVEPPEPITDINSLYVALYSYLGAARSADPDGELTSIEAEAATTATLPTTHVTVSAAEQLTPQIRSITLRGIEAGPDAGGDQFVYVMIPGPGQDRLPPGSTMQSLRSQDEDEIPPMAYYTIRRWRPETREIEAWFVLHDDHGVSGWAATVEAGASCALWGPRRGFEVAETTTRVLAFVDETGIAAAYALAESVPDVTFSIIAEWAAGTEVPAAPALPNLTVEVLERDGAPGTSRVLVEAAEAMAPPTADEAASLLVLGAAESHVVTAIRKIVRNEWQLPLDQVSCVGYWRKT